MPTIQGILWDIDGTLVDSNDAHAHAWVDAFTEAGYAATFEQIRRLVGMGGDKLAPEVTGLAEDDPKLKQITKRRGEFFKQDHLPTLKPFPQVPALLARLQEDGLRMVAASSATEKEVEQLLDIAQAADFMESQTSADDAKNSKPDPDIIQAALKTMGLQADQVVMVGDTPYDVQACQKAGVSMIGFRSGGWDDKDLAGSIAIYDGPADLLKRYGESPLGRDAIHE